MYICNIPLCLCNSKQPNLKLGSGFQVTGSYKKKWLRPDTRFALTNYSPGHPGKLTRFLIYFIWKMGIILLPYLLLRIHVKSEQIAKTRKSYAKWSKHCMCKKCITNILSRNTKPEGKGTLYGIQRKENTRCQAFPLLLLYFRFTVLLQLLPVSDETRVSCEKVREQNAYRTTFYFSE